jgi:hypothetical protein
MTHTWKIYDLKRTIADGVVTTITYGWVTNNVDTASVETLNSASIAQQIEAQAAITEVQGVPWDNSF